MGGGVKGCLDICKKTQILEMTVAGSEGETRGSEIKIFLWLERGVFCMDKCLQPATKWLKKEEGL